MNGANRFADPNDYLLKRRPQILALNNTWVLSDTSVLALRFGWTQFVDNSTMTIDFDPATLGFSPTFLNQVAQTGVPKFPQRRRSHGGYSSFGAIKPSYRTYKSWGANGSFSKFVGTHTFKMGADYRQDRRRPAQPRHRARGSFQFDKEFTSSTGLNNNSTTEGNAFASFLLGYPTADCRAPEHDDADDAARHLHQLLRRLLAGRLARQLEVHAELRPARRARRRHARSRTTTSRSASITTATSALSTRHHSRDVDPSAARRRAR